MQPIIKVSHLSKKYHLGSYQPYDTLRDTVANLFKKKEQKELKKNEFWALKDVSFSVNQGEIIGVIGRNGAGKSTLLKVLSRITNPTSGEAVLRGRVASLLEVGTGFNAELTGRENIFLNGSVLGMSHKEIKSKFVEIVSFAEVEKFIDTPVKYYSSGMYMRLAFAVAAFLNTEILFVDEVLSVGDIRFQRKSLGRMKEIASQNGKTIFFVSHNMNAIEQLCTSCILLENGCIKKISRDVPEVIKLYVNDNMGKKSMQWKNLGNEYDNEWIRPVKLYLTDNDNKIILTSISNSSPVWINIEANIKKMNEALTFGYALYNEDGQTLFWSYQTDIKDSNWPKLSKGPVHLKSCIPNNLLTEGKYKLEFIASLHMSEWIFCPMSKCPSINFEIIWGYKESSYWMTKRPGVIAPVFSWVKVKY